MVDHVAFLGFIWSSGAHRGGGDSRDSETGVVLGPQRMETTSGWWERLHSTGTFLFLGWRLFPLNILLERDLDAAELLHTPAQSDATNHVTALLSLTFEANAQHAHLWHYVKSQAGVEAGGRVVTEGHLA